MRLRDSWLLALMVAASAATPAFPQTPPPVVRAAELVDDGVSARLNLQLSRAVEATARPAGHPDRILVDLPEVDFQLDPASARARTTGAEPLTSAFRFGLVEPGKSRLVIELERPACVDKLTSASGEPAQLSLTLKPCPEAKFAELARRAPTPSVPLAAATPEAPRRLPIIVLDPGHGGADGGAQGAHGEVEKTIVFAFASEVKRQLEATGQFRVVMTRSGDQFVSLEDRVRIAREADAGLMISIHADTLPGGGADVSGTTVYTCSERASDAEAARIAERENAADRADSAPKPADAGVADILFDLKRRETRAYAHIFSRGLVGQLREAGRLNRNPERSAGFVVLKAPDFPSVLVELGYLSNAQDIANLTSAAWRQRAAAAMVGAVERFFDPSAKSRSGETGKPEAIAGGE